MTLGTSLCVLPVELKMNVERQESKGISAIGCIPSLTCKIAIHWLTVRRGSKIIDAVVESFFANVARSFELNLEEGGSPIGTHSRDVVEDCMALNVACSGVWSAE